MIEGGGVALVKKIAPYSASNRDSTFEATVEAILSKKLFISISPRQRLAENENY